MSIYTALKNLYPNATFSLRDDGEGPYIDNWDDPVEPQPSLMDPAVLTAIAEADDNYIKSIRKRKLKEVLENKLSAIEDMKKQINLLGRAIKILATNVTISDPTDQANLLAIRDKFISINDTIAYADQLEADIDAGNNPDVTSGWPV